MLSYSSCAADTGPVKRQKSIHCYNSLEKNKQFIFICVCMFVLWDAPLLMPLLVCLLIALIDHYLMAS